MVFGGKLLSFFSTRKTSKTIKYNDLNGTPTVLYSVAKQTCTAISSDFELEVKDETNLFLAVEGINVNGKHVAILGDVSKIAPLSKSRVKNISIVGKEIQLSLIKPNLRSNDKVDQAEIAFCVSDSVRVDSKLIRMVFTIISFIHKQSRGDLIKLKAEIQIASFQ